MKGTLRIEAAVEALINSKRHVDPGLTGAKEEGIEFTWLPGGPLNYGGTLKVAPPDSSCQRCQHRMGSHWIPNALCRECGCKGWLAP